LREANIERASSKPTIVPYIVSSHFRRYLWNALCIPLLFSSVAFVIRRTWIAIIVVGLVSENSPAQQTVTYSNGETGTSAILITTETNPVTLIIASGSAIQSGAITQSDTSFYGSVAKNGNGTLTLTAVNTYTGDTDINAGTLAIGAGGSIAASANIEMTGSGAIFDISGGGNQTVDILEGFTGNTVNLGANTLNIASTFSGNMEFDGTIEGSGGLAVATTQTVILAGTNTYSGGTTLNAGELAVVSSGALGTVGTISFQGGTLEFELANTTDYSNRFSTAANQRYSFDTNSELVTLAGNLNSSGGSLNKLGLGTLALTGTSTYSGATTISRGTLQLGSGGTTGKILTESSIVDNGNLAIDRSNAVVQGTDFTSTPISGSGSFTQMGSGTTTLTTANTYTGGTIVSAGKLVLGSSGTLGSSGGSLMVNTGGTLDLNGTSQSVGNLLGTGGVILNNSTGTNKFLIIGNGNASGGVFSGVIENNSGTGGTLALTEVGTGVAVLSGANTYTGITTISGGTLQLGNGGATGTLSTSSTIIDNGNFEINRWNSVRQGTDFTATALGGSGGLIQAGTGTTTLTSANTFTGDTLISAGTLLITGSGNLGSGNYAGSINDNGTLNFNIASNQNLSGSVYGLGTFIQNGTGTLTLSAPGEIGAAIVNAGTLRLSGGGEVGDGNANMTVNTGGTFNVNGVSQILNKLAGSGGVILNGATGSVLADVIEKPLLSAPQNFSISSAHYNAGEIAGLRLYLQKYQVKAGFLFAFSIVLKITLGVCAGALAANLGSENYLKLAGFAALGALIVIAFAQVRLIKSYRRFILDYASETEDRIRAETTLSALTKAA
jgi:fibronectin-binding autotransporter adhesin